MRLSVLTACALVLANAWTPPAAAAPKQVRLETSVAYGLHLPGLGKPARTLSRMLEDISGGALALDLNRPGQVVPPQDILQAVSSGKIDAGYATASFWAGDLPAAPLFSAIPFGPGPAEYLAWLYHGDGWKLWQAMYDGAGLNVKVLPCAMVAPESAGWFTKSIDAVDDLKGLKVRYFGLAGRVMRKLGAETKIIPGSKLVAALKSGELDGTEFYNPVIDAGAGLRDVAKYDYFPGWHQQSTVFEFLVNKPVWDKLGAHNQALVDTACKALMTDTIASGEAEQAPALIEDRDQHGVHLMQWKPELLEAFRKAWREVADEEAARDPEFEEVWQNLEEFREKYAVWGTRAYVGSGLSGGPEAAGADKTAE